MFFKMELVLYYINSTDHIVNRNYFQYIVQYIVVSIAVTYVRFMYEQM